MQNAAKLWIAQEGLCFYCGLPMLKNDPHSTPDPERKQCWSREHLIPRSKGGGAGTNIVLAHLLCNMKKGNRKPTAEELERAAALWKKIPRYSTPEVIKLMRDLKGIGLLQYYPHESEPKFIPCQNTTSRD